MKQGIHPKVNTDVVVTCACGNSFVTNSTKNAISVEICSNCHPFYTGKEKFIDTEGRIEKFQKKMKMAKKPKKQETKVVEESTQDKPLPSLKQMLAESKKQPKVADSNSKDTASTDATAVTDSSKTEDADKAEDSSK